MAYNVSENLQNNITALQIALEYQKGAPIDDVKISALKKYTGFGGIKAVLHPVADIEEWKQRQVTDQDLRLYPQVMELYRLLRQHFSEKEYNIVVQLLHNSTLTAFYTPVDVPVALYSIMNQHGIAPQHLYEPSAGAGIFVTEAVNVFRSLQKINAVEKDLLTGRVLQAIASSVQVVNTTVNICPFETTPSGENEKFDFIVSNIPFGNFSVFDPHISDQKLTNKIHNYFFAKALDKIGEGGLLAFITTDAFLNSPSNRDARIYLFNRADFVSVSVLPDNLMKDTGNTEAPCHLLIVQKNSQKQKHAGSEIQLINTVQRTNQYGNYTINEFIDINYERINTGDQVVEAKNQYGKAHRQSWQSGAISAIAHPLKAILDTHFSVNFNHERFGLLQERLAKPKVANSKFTFLAPPTPTVQDNTGLQLGLFDAAPAASINKAMSYINPVDETVVDKRSARLLFMIKAADAGRKECALLVAAKSKNSKEFCYKLYSGVKDLLFSANWMTARLLSHELSGLANLLRRYDHQYIYEGEPSLKSFFDFEQSVPSIYTNLQFFHKDGALAVLNERVGKLSDIDHEHNQAAFEPLALNDRDQDLLTRYIRIRDEYLQLFKKESESIADPELRNALNDHYNAFVARYSFLHSENNQRVIQLDEAYGFMVCSSLERFENGRYVKSDFLLHSLITEQTPFKTNEPGEALAHCLNQYGRVDISFIAAAIQQTEEQTVTALGDHIYLNPETRQWITADELLSGNVVEKLRIAEQQTELYPNDVQLQRSASALKKVQPPAIPFDLLDFNLGERWIPLSFYNRFATDLFEVETNINYLQSADAFRVSPVTKNRLITQEYAVRLKNNTTVYGYTLMEHAFENTTPYFTYEITNSDGTKTRVSDTEATQLAHQKIEKIRQAFSDWLQRLPDSDKRHLEKLYNDTYNCYVLRVYDGSHLTFPGLQKDRLGIEDLYPSQKNAVWRILQNRGALIDHEVGLGKTLTMIVAAHEMKRLNIIKKPCILALKANVRQIVDTFRKAYPRDRIIAPTEEDFTPRNRKRLFFEIMNNNWDCIILTHDQFSKIPQSPSVQQQIFQTELDNLKRDLDMIRQEDSPITKRMLKGLEIRKQNLEAALKSVLQQIEDRKDKDINFLDMGIDHLFVDEAHKFKNLTFTTRHNRVVGLGNPEGSQKALNMLFAVRTLQQKFNADLCVTFLSGTPISNSLTELYLLFKYLRPNELVRQRIETFDAWAAVYARKTTDFEFSVTNEIIAKERFRHFIKVPELALFYNEITDYKTAKHVQLDKPEIEEVLVNIKPSPTQQQFLKQLMDFAKTGDATIIGRRPLSADENKSRMLIATNYAKKMATDMRLIDPTRYGEEPQSKVCECARKVSEMYTSSFEHKGTQIIFCDIGTPKSEDFNIYDALKGKLVRDFNIPAEHITFIHEWPDKKKPELFKKMNRGDIRILLGSTDKAGTGLNVQRRIVAMHHLDIPWKPSDLEQRNGRGARQGNIVAREYYNNKVTSYIYAVERTLDNYKFNLLKNKQTFISQMKNCELHIRSIDEGSIDEKSGMNFNEYIAILSGDTSLLEKSRLEKRISVLESLKNAYLREKACTRRQLDYLMEEKQKNQRLLDLLAEDGTLYKSNLRFKKDGTKENPINLFHCQVADVEQIGRYIISLYQSYRPIDSKIREERIGTLYSFDLYIRSEPRLSFRGDTEHHTSLYAVNPATKVKYTYNNGAPNLDNPKLAARYFINAIDRIDHLIEYHQKELKRIETEIPGIEKLLEKPFAKEEELKILKSELYRLDREINLKIQERQQQDTDKMDKQADRDVEMNKDQGPPEIKDDVYNPLLGILLPRKPLAQERIMAHAGIVAGKKSNR